MAQKQFEFIFTPDSTYGMNLSVSFAATPAGSGDFAVGSGFSQYATIEGLAGGAKITVNTAVAAFSNFPVSKLIGSTISSGSPTITLDITVELAAPYIVFDVANLAPAIPGFNPTIEIAGQNCGLGQTIQFPMS